MAKANVNWGKTYPSRLFKFIDFFREIDASSQDTRYKNFADTKNCFGKTWDWKS